MIKDYEIPLPKWDITDPFGRNSLRRMRYELKRVMCERDSYRVELEEVLKARGAAVDAINATLRDEQQRGIQLQNWYNLSEAARKDLGDKVRDLRAELNACELARAKMRIEFERLKEEHEKLAIDHKQLQEDHEKLLRGVTDKEAEL